MITSVHIADVGMRSVVRRIGRAPRPGDVPGLRSARVAIASPLRTSARPSPDFGRLALVAFWDDEGELDAFAANHPLAAVLAGGWHARLEPLRAFGSWPGLPSETPAGRRTEYDGPAVVLTLGRLRLTQTVRFLRTSAPAEAAATAAAGLIWGTALVRPPFVATCSLWESTDALSQYAYAVSEGAHPSAIAEDRRKGFHHHSAFIRFRPTRSEGSLGGKNPLPAAKAAIASA